MQKIDWGANEESKKLNPHALFISVFPLTEI